MNTKLFAFTLLFLLYISVLSPFSSAQAKSLVPETIQVYHPKIMGNTAIGKETYKYQTLIDNGDRAVSIVEVFQPPRYDGFLLHKHVIQNPEEMYVINGDFEIEFTEKNQKIKVSTGDLVKIPAGLPFGFKHLNGGEGEIRIVSYSDALGQMLSEIGSLKADNAPDLDAIASIAQKHGIEYLN